MDWNSNLTAAATRMMAPPEDSPTAAQLRWAAIWARETAERITACVRIVRSAPADAERAEELRLPQMVREIEQGRQDAEARLHELHAEAELLHQRLARHRPELARRVPQLQLPVTPADADAIIAGLLLVHREAQIPEAT
jgi:hypothetical protein